MAFISKQAFCKGIVLDTINKQNTWRERTYAFMLELQPTFIAISASKARAIAVTPEARRSNRRTDSTVLARIGNTANRCCETIHFMGVVSTDALTV